MRSAMLTLTAVSILLASAPAAAKNKAKANPKVDLVTNHGTIQVELFLDKAPLSTKNFLEYVNAKFYDGTIFHRVIKTFMIQGGGFTEKLQKKKTRGSIKNEATNGLKNKRGTLAMARTGDPHSATAQFFINTVDNAFLDHPGSRGWGYAVFGKVVKGMDVVDKIRAARTGPKGPFGKDCPQTAVVIKSARSAK